MASNFFTRLGEMIGGSIAERMAPHPAPEAAPAEAPPAEEPVADQATVVPPEAAVEPAEVAPAAVEPAPEAWTAPAEPTPEPVAEAAPEAVAVAEPAYVAPEPAYVAPEPAATPEPAPEPVAAAPEKTPEQIEEERLWAETDQAWAAGDFPRVTALLDQLKILEPDEAVEIDQKIAAAQYNAASGFEQSGDLERALYLYQEAQRRNPELGQAGFAIERVQNALHPPAAPEPAPAEAPPEQTYTVADGDTLSAIAERFYGDANAYPRIFDANRDQLDNPDMISPGQVLRIPG